MPSYATLQDVYDLGFTAQAFVVVPRAWDPAQRKGDAIDIATGTIRMSGHGYDPTDHVEFLLLGAGSLPMGAALNTLYAPVPVDFARFKVAPVGGGPPLTFASSGSGWAIQIDPTRRLQRHLDDAYDRINEALTAQSPPLKRDIITGKFPGQVVGLNARMAARSAIPSLQFENAVFRQAADIVRGMESTDNAMLADWRAGKPLLPNVLDQDDIADNAMRARSTKPIGWNAPCRRTL